MTEDSVSLRVKRSVIAQGGRTRICKSAFDKLSITEGDRLSLEFGRSAIIVSGYTDDFVEDGYIAIKKNI